jgi:hypothetical protein
MKSTNTIHYQGKKGDGFQGDQSQGEEKRDTSPIGDPGRPTTRGMLRKERSGGYTKYTILSDIIDESVLHCMKKQGHLKIHFHPSAVDERKLSSITIFDDIDNGFTGLDINGEKNPLNLIHYGGIRHTEDEEWSQYGVGLTAASMCCAGVWTLTTRYKTQEGTFKYVTLKFCWEDMATDNVILPESKEILEEEYNKINPFHKGTVFKYTGCFNNIFSGDFKKNVHQLVKMISTKYYKALISEVSGVLPEVKYAVFDSIGDETEFSTIKAEIPPTEKEDHPHVINKYKVQLRQNDKGDERIIYKEITTAGGTKWHQEQSEHSNFNAISNKDFNIIEKDFPKIVDTLYYNGTRVSGTEWCSSGLPLGSLVIERYGRIMTEDVREEGSYIGFNTRKSTGEYNYHYYHLQYKHKPIGDNFSGTYRKIIDGNLMINDTPLNRVLKEITRKLQACIGGETKFKKTWASEHNGVNWDEQKTYAENVACATNPPDNAQTTTGTASSTTTSSVTNAPTTTNSVTNAPATTTTNSVTNGSSPKEEAPKDDAPKDDAPKDDAPKDDRILQCVSSLSESIMTFKEAWPDMDIIVKKEMKEEYKMVVILVSKKN